MWIQFHLGLKMSSESDRQSSQDLHCSTSLAKCRDHGRDSAPLTISGAVKETEVEIQWLS